MDTGAMNQRIQFERRTTAANENGFEREDWQPYYTCWAYVNGLSGREYWAAQSVQAEKTVVFTIRYCRDAAKINPKEFRILFHGEVYNITNVDIVRFENDTIKIKGVAA